MQVHVRVSYSSKSYQNGDKGLGGQYVKPGEGYMLFDIFWKIYMYIVG